MVFSNLTDNDKGAFFALLDELSRPVRLRGIAPLNPSADASCRYFTSRPHLFGGASENEIADARADAAKVVLGGLKHVSSPGGLISSSATSTHDAHSPSAFAAGLRAVQAAAPRSPTRPAAPGRSGGSPAPPPMPPRRASSIASEEEPAHNVRPSSFVGSRGLSPAPPPPMPPRRGSSVASEDEPPAGNVKPSSLKGGPPAGLVATKKFGDVDVTSAKGMYSSIRHGTVNKTAKPPAVTVPPAFTPKQNAWAPPPRRTISTAESEEEPQPQRSTPSPAPRAPPPPLRRAEPEPEPEGEWAEVLYDYDSGEPGDLKIEANERVLVVERSSEDWWTGEIEGRRGLFPASYVKIM
ncbi:hypothetical protein PUNSTDRAFT_132327 [Punctularia strigosozonata HHB-11173 SS5]|uniref:uncharacterized protein n=1 Tax=Punctularia strigosozonata (strain HHB-11173) TaxID=741275 RepID=UPI0004416A7C|nr:uncharacterized protein PUNSTDRAFT_132327 [Punctularia strigosozonata HHB-11173 SS5]EIN10232.1 hypothetical protein PUNSTDRAFT_132327 [Punctularia strigosozonata HHB-11173 SS5]